MYKKVAVHNHFKLVTILKIMMLSALEGKIPEQLMVALKKDIVDLRPAQEKAVQAGLLEKKSVLVCTPTASGKTNIAVLAMLSSILQDKGKALYVVPLKALASEKYGDFQDRFGHLIRIGISIGQLDSKEPNLVDKDLIIATSEKLDSLLRHHVPWIHEVKVLVIDEIHLLNDPGRGPTLEVLITLLRQILPHLQIVGLSATIGNPEELAEWLGAALVIDDWRPVKLEKGVYFQNKIEFFEEKK
ncbi:MAG: helicase [archaeon GW2011_AR4]|nr:MAG: helicase [archaeon GW2011_AR4]